MSRITRVLWIGIAALGFDPVLADTFDEYLLAEEFTLPAGGGPFDFLDDGRIIVVAGAEVYLEDAIRSRTFTFLGTLENANIPGFGAAFVRVSPDGEKVAVGNNGFGKGAEVGIFEPQATKGVISVSWYDEVQHFQAAWHDNDTLLLTVGFPTTAVTALDISDPEAPTITVVITNIGGASAGVALDAEGNLYTGNGYAFRDAGLSETGWVKAFTNADWTAALAGGAALDFEAGGVLVVDLLSASPLGFDAEGNLYVGGSDSFGSGDSDYAGLVRASAVGAALAGGQPADPDDPLQVRRIDPDDEDDDNLYDVNFNATTCELIIREGELTYVYQGTNPFAAQAVQYVQGGPVGFDSINGEPFTDPYTALGRPTVDTTDITGGEGVPLVAVNAAFRAFEIVSIGIGGHLTLKFNHPVKDHPCNPYGVDFIVYGNAFQIGGPFWTNGDPTEAAVGSTTFAERGLVSVSQDGIEWFTFEGGPEFGPFADDFAPTLGRVFDPVNPDLSLGDWNEWWGQPTDPTKPLDPMITAAVLSEGTVAEAASLYDGAAGGTGFDIGDLELDLDWIQYIRIEEFGMGIPEIDAVADVAASSGAGALGADLDGNGTVGVPDLILLLGSWGACPCCPADLDGDGKVRVPDLIILLGSWG